MTRAHVLYLLNNLGTGGTQRIVSELATHLDPDRYKVSVASVTETPPEKVDSAMIRKFEAHGIAVTSLQRQGTRKTMDPIRRLYHLLKAEHVDILHTGIFQPDFYGMIAGSLARTPVRVRTFHVTQQWPDSSRWIGRIAEPVLKRLATHSTAVSNASRQSIAKDLGIDPARIQLIPNAVEIPEPVRDRTALRRALAFDERPVVAIIGRLASEKHHDTFLQAAKALEGHPRSPLFVIVGDGDLRPQLERQATELGLGDSVRFLGRRSDMADLYQAIDVVVNASWVEGLSMTLLEALAAHKTIVASAIPSNEEIIHHERTGLVFPVGSVEQLAAALQRVLDDPELAARLAIRGYELACQEYGLDRMVQRYEALYQSGLQRQVALRPVYR